MSTDTPEREPYTKPTPANVAEMLTSDDNLYHDGNLWRLGLAARGNVLEVDVTPDDEDGNELPEVHFRAVVAAVSEETAWNGPLDFCTHPSKGRVTLAVDKTLDLSPEEAYAAAAQLIAAAALAVQAEAQTGGAS